MHFLKYQTNFDPIDCSSVIQKYCIISLLSLFISNDTLENDLNWRCMESIHYGLSTDEYELNNIYFYSAIVDHNEASDTAVEQIFRFDDHARPLDIFNYWKNKGDENYHVLFTKTAYVLDKEVSFFSKERLSDIGFISRTMPIADVSFNDSSFHMSMGLGCPDIDYTLHSYESDKHLLEEWMVLDQYFNKHDGLGMEPKLTALQHNYQYGRVMFQKTSKASISITRYFQKSNEETLVMNYTLNYIHNMPPEIIGGYDFLLKKIKEGIEGLILETRKACKEG